MRYVITKAVLASIFILKQLVGVGIAVNFFNILLTIVNLDDNFLVFSAVASIVRDDFAKTSWAVACL